MKATVYLEQSPKCTASLHSVTNTNALNSKYLQVRLHESFNKWPAVVGKFEMSTGRL